MIFTKKPETKAEIDAAVAELEALKQQQEQAEQVKRQYEETRAKASAQVEKLLAARTKEILDAYHQRLADDLHAAAEARARAQLEFELVDPIPRPTDNPRAAEVRERTRAQVAPGLYKPLGRPWDFLR